jgi:hypothetical protein
MAEQREEFSTKSRAAPFLDVVLVPLSLSCPLYFLVFLKPVQLAELPE